MKWNKSIISFDGYVFYEKYGKKGVWNFVELSVYRGGLVYKGKKKEL